MVVETSNDDQSSLSSSSESVTSNMPADNSNSATNSGTTSSGNGVGTKESTDNKEDEKSGNKEEETPNNKGEKRNKEDDTTAGSTEGNQAERPKKHGTVNKKQPRRDKVDDVINNNKTRAAVVKTLKGWTVDVESTREQRKSNRDSRSKSKREKLVDKMRRFIASGQQMLSTTKKDDNELSENTETGVNGNASIEAAANDNECLFSDDDTDSFIEKMKKDLNQFCEQTEDDMRANGFQL